MVQRVYNHYSTRRKDMIEQTTHFLNWALGTSHGLPRIPRVRVDGGIRFSERIKVAFWSAVLLKMDQIGCPSEKPPR